MKVFINATVLLILLCFSTSQASESNYAKVDFLLGSVSGKTVQAALAFEIQEGWHIYASTPGDTGVPTTLSFQDSSVEESQIHWPKAEQRIDNVEGEVFTSNVYYGKVVLPVNAIIPIGGKSITLKVNFSVCGQTCIPQSKTLVVNVPESNFTDNAVLQLINEWMEK